MLSLLATVCAGLFSGAAIYVNLVEHPARLSCGTELAVKDPSYRRCTVMQASLALALIVLLPTNKKLLDPSLDARSTSAAELLRRWGWLHGVRSILSLAAFVLLLTRLVGRR